MSAENLLVELFVEELPPKALNKLGQAFATVLGDQLKAQGLAAGPGGEQAGAGEGRAACEDLSSVKVDCAGAHEESWSRFGGSRAPVRRMGGGDRDASLVDADP